MKATVIYNNPVFTICLCEVEPGTVERVEELPNLPLARKNADGTTTWLYFDMRVNLSGESRITEEMRMNYPQWCRAADSTYEDFIRVACNSELGLTQENFNLQSNWHEYRATFGMLRYAGNDGECEVKFSTGPNILRATYNDLLLVVPRKGVQLELIKPDSKVIVKIGSSRMVGFFASGRNVHGGKRPCVQRAMLKGNGNFFPLIQATLYTRLPQLAHLVSFEPYLESYDWSMPLSSEAGVVLAELYRNGGSLTDEQISSRAGLDELVELGLAAIDDPMAKWPNVLTDRGLQECRLALRY